jgi:hypothetical protein
MHVYMYHGRIRFHDHASTITLTCPRVHVKIRVSFMVTYMNVFNCKTKQEILLLSKTAIVIN